MVHRAWKFAAILFGLTALGLGAVVLQTRPRPAADAEVRTVLDRQKEAWNRGDLDGYMAEYHMSDETTMFGGPTVRQGWTVILDNYRKKYQGEGRAMGVLAFDNVTVESLGPGTALARGRWKVYIDGTVSGGLFTLILKRIDGAWKIVHDHTS